MEQILQALQEPIWLLGLLMLAGLVGHFIIPRINLKHEKKGSVFTLGLAIKHCWRPFQWLIVLLIISLVIPALSGQEYIGQTRHVLSLLFIVVLSWLLIKIVCVASDYILARFSVDERDNLRARKVHTQLNVVKRIITVIVCLLAFGTMLTTFDKVRQLGTTLLASAGVIGIVVGIAAQRTIGTLIAGLQIALTQPIRIDDVVIVENEWGRIEEITLTYVVVRIWDLRRLVLPITYFIEKPFQNWTRVTADLLGTVYLYVDHTTPTDAVRAELKRICENSEHWDGKVCGLQVTNTSERVIELRALMSAKDASILWTLRCEAREKLVEFMQKNYPQHLPKIRAELKQDNTSNRPV